MELEFWGVRGTFPVSEKEKMKYGGHTLCASLISPQGEVIIIDGGTGIKNLGNKLIRQSKGEVLPLYLLLTHFHLDHILGFPFFAPLYSSRTFLTIYAPSEPEETKKYLAGLMGGRYYPLSLQDAKSIIFFKKLEGKNFTLSGVQVSYCALHHPQGSVAYRLEASGKSVVFATDTEHPETGIDEKLAHFAQGATHFIYDATYTPEEYRTGQGKRRWGHSTWLEGTRLAQAAKVGELILSHWNPDHSDQQLDEVVALAQKEFRFSCGAQERLKRFF
jgi:phosphoribosyl 1,2-cyclic phosphodiesterase